MTSIPWRDQWFDWRNRRLTDPLFQRWAAEFPLTRGIAKRRAQSLFDLVAGFVYSQTLSICVRLGLLEILRSGPQTSAALAERLDLSLDNAERLLGAAEALELVDRAGPARYALGAQGAALLGNPGLVEMIEHHRHLYADLAKGEEMLRQGGGRGELAAYWPYATSATPAGESAEQVSAYSTLMAASQPAVAADILHAYPMRRHKLLMDIGGGEGAFLAAAGGAAPKLEMMLFDLPSVTERARARLAQAGLSDRTQVVAGDFLSEPIPRGADLITLIRILHDHDDQGVQTLLHSVRAALPTDGALLIAEPMSGEGRRARVADVYFAFYLLAMGRGRARTPAQIAAMLRTAGFTRIRQLPTRTPFLLRAILARP